MSYIHEALKKAQDERDMGKGSYSGIMAPQKKKPRFTLKNAILWTVPLLLVLLAFAGYSWWDLKNEKRRITPSPYGAVEKPMPEAMPNPKKPGANHHLPVQESAAACYEKARSLHREGLLSDAETGYEKVILMDPGHVQALNNLGVLHLHEKNYPAARRFFEKAIRLKPDYVDPYYNLACVAAATDQADQGLRYLEKAISLDPNVREWARKDPDLDALRESVLFREMVGK